MVMPSGGQMIRREFITLISIVAAWPTAVHAQQSAMPVIGFLDPTSPDKYAPFVEAFRKGLGEAGFVEGRNVAIEFRWAEGRHELLPKMAGDLVRHKVAVIVATGGKSTHALFAPASLLLAWRAG